MMWFLEHLPDDALAPVLAEARRVLCSDGTVTVVETDYSMFHPLPADADIEALGAAQRELFRRHGQPAVGRALGALLAAAGFRRVRSGPVGFHHFSGAEDAGAFRRFIDYLLGFLEPMVPRLAIDLGLDPVRLAAGVEKMRALPDRPGTSFTQVVFRATAIR
jgi:hypothetical protein